MRTNEDHLAARKQEILAAAAKVFDARGYASTTVEAIAEQAGIAKGSIYNYFQSKEDLFAQVFNALMSVEFTDFRKVTEADLTAVEKLNRMLEIWYERLERYSGMAGLFLEFWTAAIRQGRHSEQFAGPFQTMYRDSCSLIEGILVQGAAAGEFGRQFDTPLAAALIVAILDGIHIESVLRIGLRLDEQFLAGLKRGILAAMGVTAGPESSRMSGNE